MVLRAAICAGILASAAWGQCAAWLPGTGLPGASNVSFVTPSGSVQATVRWDPDGAGPLPDVLVLGGDFRVAGDRLARNIAIWDGRSFHPLGEGTDGPVAALAVHQGRLIAGGSFTHAGEVLAQNIAAWDGANWSPLGSGISGPVESLVIHGDQLAAGGSFDTAGGAPARNVATWNGAAWEALDAGLDSLVLDLYSYNNLLLAGGYFSVPGSSTSALAAWDGTAWGPVGDWPWQSLYADGFAEFGGKLYVCGNFFNENGPTATLMRLDGTHWTAPPDQPDSGAYCLAATDDALYVGGQFENVGPLPTGYVARFDGESWSSLDSGVNNTVLTIIPWADGVAVGGYFTNANDERAVSIAGWDGEEWQRWGDGLSDFAYFPTIVNDELYTTGRFWFRPFSILPEYGVLRWTGSGWAEVGGPQWQGTRPVLGAVGGQLVAAGYFAPEGQPASGNVVARWTGSQWQPFTTPVDNQFSALGELSGQLVAAGYFNTSGSTSLRRVARWDGSAWVQMNDGLFLGNSFNTIYSFASHQGSLYAGGAFGVLVPGGAASGIARWDSAANRWQSIAGGAGVVNESLAFPAAQAMASFDGELYVGGSLTGGTNPDGSIVRFSNVGRWDGSSWRAAGSGSGYQVLALRVVSDALYATGRFDGGTEQPTQVGRWRGTTWETLPGQFDGSGAYELAQLRDELIVTGSFTGVDDTVGCRIVRWTTTGRPWIAEQPAPQTVSQGSTLTLRAQAASGYAVQEFQWRRGDQVVGNGPGGAAPGGGTVSGAGTDTLTITLAQPADAGTYQCTLVTACASVPSDAVVVQVFPTCDPDLTRDGNVDQDDIAYCINVLAGGSNPLGIDPDFNRDGNADQDDVDALINVVAGGACP